MPYRIPIMLCTIAREAGLIFLCRLRHHGYFSELPPRVSPESYEHYPVFCRRQEKVDCEQSNRETTAKPFSQLIHGAY
jgi:hypothetical protein